MTNENETKFESLTGIREGLRQEAESWVTALQDISERVNAVPVRVLFWGPGRYSKQNYDKRMQLVAHLQRMSAPNDVATSEQLDELVPQLVAEIPVLQDREELHARRADVIFVLLVSEDQVTGPQAEIVAIRSDRRLRAKTWLFLPHDWDWEKAGYLSQAVSDSPNERKKRYTFRQIRDCNMMRSFCEEKLREIRAERIMEQERARRLLDE
jgi:hypothetical protein